MARLRLPRVFFVYVVLAALQPALLVLTGNLAFDSKGLVILVPLLLGLAFGSRLAWGLLILIDVVPLLASAVAAVTIWPWSSGVLVGLLTSTLIMATLLCSSMRAHVEHEHRREAPRPT